MKIVIIDSGTTNTRLSIVDEVGTVYCHSSESIGFRDTAATGTNIILKECLRRMLGSALEKTGVHPSDIHCVLASGMITSELGLMEIPHLRAPCTRDMLASSMQQYYDISVFPGSIPVFLIPGITNACDPRSSDLSNIDMLDFMRGEETQIIGLLENTTIRTPCCVVVLSSHTKFISVEAPCTILGSITTLSGQLFNALKSETIIGKSLQPQKHQESILIDETIVEHARSTLAQHGFLRSLMHIRFMDTLQNSPVEDRLLMIESLLAAEDLRSLPLVMQLNPEILFDYIFIGSPNRCRVYKYVLQQILGQEAGSISTITDPHFIDLLSIHGSLALAKTAGII